MYGYIKPLKGELKVREYEHYKATYCGLCNALKRKYGLLSRFLVNYDFSFLAIVLEAMAPEGCIYDRKRCIASPFKKKCACAKSRAIDFTAAATVVLAHWKMRDNIADKSFIKGLPYRFLKFIYNRPYKKAKKELLWFDGAVEKSITKLNVFEKKNEKSIDAVADTFAELLASMADYFDDMVLKRIAKELFYHAGRIIYIIDALFDVEEDLKNNNYNPIIASRIAKEQVVATINCSLNTAVNTWALISENPLTDIVLNVLTMGIPSVIEGKGEQSK